MSNIILKKIALGILLLPIGILFIFLFGEVFGGEISGLIHLFQVVPLILLALLAWKKPLWGGIFISFLSIVLGILYIFSMSFPIQTVIIAELILFLPTFVAGCLFILSSRK